MSEIDVKDVPNQIRRECDSTLRGLTADSSAYWQMVGALPKNEALMVQQQVSNGNWIPDGFPKADVQIGADGHIIGISCTPPLLDYRSASTPYNAAFAMWSTGHGGSGDKQ